MKKESFHYLYSFRYKNSDYIYLFSKNYPFYFLKYNDSTKGFYYPDLDTFKDLYSIFYSHDSYLCYIQNPYKIIHKAISNLSINVHPFVRATSGLLSLALVLSMCGCHQTENTQPTTTDTSISIASGVDKELEILQYFKGYDMDVIDKIYDGNDYIFVNSFINNDHKKQITIQDFDEFRSFINLDFIPSWDDVVEAFKENDNIDDEKKEIILEAIHNLRDSDQLKGLDLSVLYANAKRMKIQYDTSEKINSDVNRETAYAYFDTVTGVICIPNDIPLKKFEFIHEVIGHGSLAYREETDDSLIVFDCTNHLMIPTDTNYTGYSVGIMVSEGGANIIAHLATHDDQTHSFYELFEEELRVIADLCHVSLGELFNHKGISLYDLMYQNGINTPVEYIFKMDGICRGELRCEFSNLMERLFVDATEEKFLSSDANTQNKIIQDTIDIIQDSYFQDRDELYFPYVGGTIQYDFAESASQYEDDMNQLRGNK